MTVRASAKKIETDLQVICAIDPFESDLERVRSLEQAISACLKPSRVRAVSFLYPMILNLPAQVAKSLKRELLGAANDTLTAALGRTEGTEIEKPLVLTESSGSKRVAAARLSEHAVATGAGAIAVNTHGRRGMERLRLGSFAESVIAMADVPVLVTGPDTKIAKQVKSIFVPTDLSKASFASIERIIPFARRLGASLEIVHVLESPVPQLAGPSFTASFDARWFAEASREAERAQRAQAKRWAVKLERMGVPAKITTVKSVEGIESALVEKAKSSKSSMVAMASYLGPFAQAMLGGLAREMILRSGKPVLVFRAERSN